MSFGLITEGTTSALFNKNTKLIAFKNGIFNLENGEFSTQNYGEYVNVVIGHDYNIEHYNVTTKVDIMNILSCMFPDPEELDYVLGTLSQCLTGVNKYKQIYLWLGDGSNGKSKLNGFMNEVLGRSEYYHHIDIRYFLEPQSYKHDFTLGPLASKVYARCVFGQYAEQRKFNINKLRSVLGINDVDVRKLHGNVFTYNIKWPLFILANYLPDIFLLRKILDQIQLDLM